MFQHERTSQSLTESNNYIVCYSKGHSSKVSGFLKTMNIMKILIKKVPWITNRWSHFKLQRQRNSKCLVQKMMRWSKPGRLRKMKALVWIWFKFHGMHQPHEEMCQTGLMQDHYQLAGPYQHCKIPHCLVFASNKLNNQTSLGF